MFFSEPKYVSDPIEYTNGAGENVVYYFYNEVALEYQNADKRVFPRVGRFCRVSKGITLVYPTYYPNPTLILISLTLILTLTLTLTLIALTLILS